MIKSHMRAVYPIVDAAVHGNLYNPVCIRSSFFVYQLLHLLYPAFHSNHEEGTFNSHGQLIAPVFIHHKA